MPQFPFSEHKGRGIERDELEKRSGAFMKWVSGQKFPEVIPKQSVKIRFFVISNFHS